MFNAIRKHQRILMLIVVILTILAFTFFYTRTSSIDYEGKRKVGSAYGSVMTPEDVHRLAENYQLAIVLGLDEMLESLGGMTRDESVSLNNFILNQLIVEHEAKTLGVEPKDSQVALAITERPIFQTGGRFDSDKYRGFIKNQLIPRGIRENQLEELIRNSLRVASVRKIVTGSVTVSDQEIRNAFRGYQKQNLQVVTFDLENYANKVRIPEDQIKQLYEKQSAELKSPETRTVRYVVFKVPKEKELLQGKERVEALQAVADQAAGFSESLSENKISLEETAHQAGLLVHTSLPIDRTGSGLSAEAFQGDLPNLVPAIFQLSQKEPHSEALEGSQKTHFYVFELNSITPSRPLSFEEAHPELLDFLRKQAARKLLYEEGGSALASISKQLYQGQSLAEATAKIGGKVQNISGTALYSSSSPENALYNEVALFLSPGQLSSLQPSPKGAFSVFLRTREAINSSELAQKKDSLKAQLLKNKQTLLFLEWLQGARKRANIHIN